MRRGILGTWKTDMHRQSAGPASDVRIIDPATGKVRGRIRKRPAPKKMYVPTKNSIEKLADGDVGSTKDRRRERKLKRRLKRKPKSY
jgi:hypothetical protein